MQFNAISAAPSSHVDSPSKATIAAKMTASTSSTTVTIIEKATSCLEAGTCTSCAMDGSPWRSVRSALPRIPSNAIHFTLANGYAETRTWALAGSLAPARRSTKGSKTQQEASLPFDVVGRAIYPLSDLISAADFPFAEYIRSDVFPTVFDRLYYTEASAYEQDGNVVFDLHLVFEGELDLAPPGCDAFALVFGSADEEWTAIHLELTIGPEFAATIHEATVGIRMLDQVLSDVDSGRPALIEFQGDLVFSPEGIVFENATGASLGPAYLCGTKIIVEADDVRPVFGVIDPPLFITDDAFQGLTFDQLAVTIPPEYLTTDPGQSLQIEITECAISTSGFTGSTSVESPDPANPVQERSSAFPCGSSDSRSIFAKTRSSTRHYMSMCASKRWRKTAYRSGLRATSPSAPMVRSRVILRPSNRQAPQEVRHHLSAQSLRPSRN